MVWLSHFKFFQEYKFLPLSHILQVDICPLFTNKYIFLLFKCKFLFTKLCMHSYSENRVLNSLLSCVSNHSMSWRMMERKKSFRMTRICLSADTVKQKMLVKPSVKAPIAIRQKYRACSFAMSKISRLFSSSSRLTCVVRFVSLQNIKVEKLRPKKNFFFFLRHCHN